MSDTSIQTPMPKGTAGTADNASAIGAYFRNLRRLPRIVRDSIVRHGTPDSDRVRSQAVNSNFFLHLASVRTHRHSLRFMTTVGLGVMTLVLFFLLTITGILLMVYYKPSVDQAYQSMKDIVFVVPTGRFMRNLHRWSAHAMVACVILHMARVFYTSAYKQMREFNWVLGMGLFVLTLLLSFTGYLLPWDQLAFWAITVGSNIAQSPQEVTDVLGITQQFDPGGFTKEVMLGAHYVGQEALIRFYVLHVMVLPLLLTVIIGVHFWRIRKDGGLARPAEVVPETPQGTNADGTTKTWGLMGLMRGKTPQVDKELANTVPAYPGMLYAVAALAMLTTAAMLLLSYVADAPLTEIANPTVPENPAKAPWYFLGLQELVGYSAFMGGVAIPGIAVIGLALIPYLDRENEQLGIWFSGTRGRRVAMASLVFTTLVTIGMLIFTVNFEWLREWYPTIPQWVIILLNPGTVLVALFAIWSLGTVIATNSTRQGAIALFTCFLVSFVILTYFATVHRGPNWDFYWWPTQWPAH
ncbi:MAG: cytochrome b N-terminal domain-containing protein [Phycisphaerae bacterium]|jgi:quinol-cytochrome oxidoreductase complex cytochrome b subunit